MVCLLRIDSVAKVLSDPALPIVSGIVVQYSALVGIAVDNVQVLVELAHAFQYPAVENMQIVMCLGRDFMSDGTDLWSGGEPVATERVTRT